MVATAPVRVCDAGGWTDTWFAGGGVVCNLAARPGVRVEVTRGPGVTFATPPTPLLEAAVAEAGAANVHIAIRSDAPAASSLGSSAAVVVALLAALGVPRHELVSRAHRVETERLGLQSGVQDQVAAVHGGASLIDVEYPQARRRAVRIPANAWRDLDARLLTVAFGVHSSSAVHDEVIAHLTADTTPLAQLRACAQRAADALTAGDVRAYGAALVDNTEAQRALHPALINGDAQGAIDAARDAGALGWKVNGAGGPGGSVTIVCGDRRPVVPVGVVLPLRLARQGVRVHQF